MSEERILSLYVDDRGGKTLPMFLSLIACRTPESTWYCIQACNLQGVRLCKARVFGSARRVRQRWAECTGGEFLDEALFQVFEELGGRPE